MSKSAVLCEAILKQRKEHIWQIALPIFLCQHQGENGCHFHCEQPQGCQMLKLLCFRPIIQETSQCTFDLCQVGNLREPVSQEPMRKSFVVCTTSKELYNSLNNEMPRKPPAPSDSW